jgi:hypothetical protein
LNPAFNSRFFIAWFLGVWLAAPSLSQTPDFSVDYFVISAGGGTSANGGFSVTGVVGQPVNPNQITGGMFTIETGFASVTATIQLLDGPVTLRINQQGGLVKISWPATTQAEFVLETTSQLGDPSSWQPVELTPLIVGPDKIVTIGAGPGPAFFRLREREQP